MARKDLRAIDVSGSIDADAVEANMDEEKGHGSGLTGTIVRSLVTSQQDHLEDECK